MVVVGTVGVGGEDGVRMGWVGGRRFFLGGGVGVGDGMRLGGAGGGGGVEGGHGDGGEAHKQRRRWWKQRKQWVGGSTSNSCMAGVIEV